MDRKKLLLLAAALVVALGAAIAVNLMVKGEIGRQAMAAQAPTPTGPQILVATRALPVGTILTPDMVRFQPWPADLVESAYYKQGSEDATKLTGAVVRTAITAGQPLTTGALVQPGDRGFLAAALTPGMRAVTIKVQDDASVAGFVFPGDRVDLVVTQELKGGDDGNAFRAAETFLRNVRVLATDQRTTSKNAEGKDEVKAFGLVTLEVTPKMAEEISVAQRIGQITMVLRSLADSQAELERAIASGDVALPKGIDARKERELLDQMSSRPTSHGATATTGGQVSRFQRAAPAPQRNVSSGGGESRIYVPQPTMMAPGMAVAAAPGGSGSMVRVNRGGTVTEIAVGSN